MSFGLKLPRDQMASLRFEDVQSYLAACDAHRDGQRAAVSGVLQRDARSKVYELLQPQSFQVLNS